jgi:hypothetical protein
MSEMSFGAGAEARGRNGNVFLALAEVKRATSEGHDQREMFPDQREMFPIVYGKRLQANSIFTFPVCCSSLPHMTNLWFSATYYYGVFGYNRWGPGSRVR